MPAKSGKQYRLMAGVMAGSIKGSGIDKETASHFVHETPSKKRKKFAKNLKEKKGKGY